MKNLGWKPDLGQYRGEPKPKSRYKLRYRKSGKRQVVDWASPEMQEIMHDIFQVRGLDAHQAARELGLPANVVYGAMVSHGYRTNLHHKKAGEYTTEEKELITRMRTIGLSIEKTANVLGLSYGQLANYMRRDGSKAVRYAIEDRREKLIRKTLDEINEEFGCDY